MKIVSWIFRISAAVIMLQTLYFKFTGAEESIKLFTLIRMEPWGRYAVGTIELIASILLLVPKTKIFGALLGMGLICGALFFHFTQIGIVDGSGSALLFIYACIALFSCALILVIHFDEIKNLLFKK
jgi:hypothetical protein